jgi:3-methyladenine DNA glycosylase/8-oxoguanine DNA glycosylase
MDSLVPACLEQRVTGNEAWTAWRGLVWAHGEVAAETAGGSARLPPVDSEPDFEEGPTLRVAADPASLRAVPSWDWHRFGVDLQRHKAIRAAATVAGRLEECVALTADGDFGGAHSRLRLVPGIGEWTAAETAVRALGDPDAVSVGDFHLKNLVGYVLTGSHRTDDATMLELLEPWRGQRARVIRLIELSGITPPKYGPRFSPNDIRRI